MDIRNKTVKAKEGLIEFMFPQYKVAEEITPLLYGEQIIFRGKNKANLKQEIGKLTDDFISLVGVPDIDLQDKNNLLELVQSKWGNKSKLKQSQIKILESLSEDDFYDFIKIYWVTGEWPKFIENKSEYSVYKLFDALATKDNRMLMTIYFSLLKEYPFYVIEASVLKMIQRSKNPIEQDVKKGYKSILKSFESKVNSNINNAINSYISRMRMREDLRFLMFIMDIRR